MRLFRIFAKGKLKVNHVFAKTEEDALALFHERYNQRWVGKTTVREIVSCCVLD